MAVMTLWTGINPRMERAMVKEKEVVRKVFTLWERLECVSSGGKKKVKGKKKRGKQYNLKEDFVSNLDRLFDICSCHCQILSCVDSGCPTSCLARVHIACSCPKESKIPLLELEFIYDQRRKLGVRGKMMIGGKDAVETARLEKATKREEQEKRRRGKGD